jgi:hypothetical protein
MTQKYSIAIDGMTEKNYFYIYRICPNSPLHKELMRIRNIIEKTFEKVCDIISEPIFFIEMNGDYFCRGEADEILSELQKNKIVDLSQYMSWRITTTKKNPDKYAVSFRLGQTLGYYEPRIEFVRLKPIKTLEKQIDIPDEIMRVVVESYGTKWNWINKLMYQCFH